MVACVALLLSGCNGQQGSSGAEPAASAVQMIDYNRDLQPAARDADDD